MSEGADTADVGAGVSISVCHVLVLMVWFD